jgi:FkbM family methyltransferase
MADSVFAKAAQYVRYRTVFRTHRDVEQYRQVRDHPERCDGPVPLRVRGASEPLFCRPHTMDPITLWDSLYVGFHLPVMPLERPAVILDLGANAGYTAASFAMRYPTARVIAVEMDADNAAACAANVAQFGSRCTVINAAIWSSSGTVNYGGANVHDFAIGAGQQTAPAMTIDEVLNRWDIPEVDYLKMDIEGAEASVLRPPLSWASRVRALSVEVHPPATMAGCRSMLTEAGFACETHPIHRAGLVARRPTPGL